MSDDNEVLVDLLKDFLGDEKKRMFIWIILN